MRGLWTLILALATGGAAWAQDQQLGARTKAMGGSYTAFEDDPVSVWLNPAGIASQNDSMSIAYQSYTAYPVSREPGPMDTTISTVGAETVLADPAIIPSYVGFVFRLGTEEAPMAAGICFARPYLLNYAMDMISDPAQTVFDPENEVEQSLSRFRVAFARDFRLRPVGEAGFLTHVAAGVGLDVGYERWEFRTPTGTTTDSAAGLGFGGGILVGLYDDGESFRANLGVAYQSEVEYNFSIKPDLQPAFNMPSQFNVGMTFYLLQEYRLRATFDAQWIGWEETAEEPVFAGHPRFEDVVNLSVGFEYRVTLTDRVQLYPRAGFRRFDAPWADPDDLPATGRFKLVLDTDDEVFNIFTFGLGIGWSTEGGKSRSIDVAGEAGGDAPNVALGYTHEF